MERKVRLELLESEFDMIIEKLKWMRCVIRDSDLDYTDYCNGECGLECNRPEFCDFEEWFKSKLITINDQDPHCMKPVEPILGPLIRKELEEIK